MYSIRKCRDLLGDEALPDEQVVEIRDMSYALAQVVLDVVSDKTMGDSVAKEERFEAFLRMVSDEDRDYLQERVAVLQFGEGLNRNEAEKKALDEICVRVMHRCMLC